MNGDGEGEGGFEGVQNAPHHSCSLIESRLPKCQIIHCVLNVELFQLVWHGKQGVPN